MVDYLKAERKKRKERASGNFVPVPEIGVTDLEK